METTNIKKNLQKTIKTIREERSNAIGREVSFPKAMMTSAQARKGEATVNCGGEWYGRNSKPIAESLMEDIRFRGFLEETDGEAVMEYNPRFDSYQVRIRF